MARRMHTAAARHSTDSGRPQPPQAPQTREASYPICQMSIYQTPRVPRTAPTPAGLPYGMDTDSLKGAWTGSEVKRHRSPAFDRRAHHQSSHTRRAMMTSSCWVLGEPLEALRESQPSVGHVCEILVHHDGKARFVSHRVQHSGPVVTIAE